MEDAGGGKNLDRADLMASMVVGGDTDDGVSSCSRHAGINPNTAAAEIENLGVCYSR